MSRTLMTSLVSPATLLKLRKRTRQLALLFGLQPLQTTRLVTAVSEIACNTVNFAQEGHACFSFEPAAAFGEPQYLVVSLSDQGPGIVDLPDLLAGLPGQRTKAPMGLLGAKRLVDGFQIHSEVGCGTSVSLKMAIAPSASEFDQAALDGIAAALLREEPPSPLEELARQNRDMLTALEELRLRQLDLERADERKNHFVAMLAHELRTPLGTLQMSLEILGRRRELPAEDFSRRLEVMGRQTVQMAKLLSDLQDVSRVSQGRIDLSLAPVELKELLKQTADMCARDISSRGHTLSVSHDEGDLWSLGDATRLKQVFGNLLQNAARYTPAGGSIHIRSERSRQHAQIAISDNGIGMAPEVLPHVFDLFVQGRPGAVTGHSGLGIGLTLVRRLVEEHQGSVIAHSDGVGLGSTFTVRLPLNSAH
jgi:signal transduction histidine kinase